MIIIGLTGSMGMGKTEVGRLFAQQGIPVIETDTLVHELYADPHIVAQVGRLFPFAIERNSISRTKLTAHFQKKPDDLKKLERIIHPAVKERRAQLLKRLCHEPLVVLIIPLLFETGSEKDTNITIVVSCPPALQRKRILSRPGMTPSKLNLLLARQMPDSLKRTKADFIIPTDEPLTQTEKRVHDIIAAIMSNPHHTNS